MRHAPESFQLHALIDERAFRISENKDPRVGKSEGPLAGRRIYGLRCAEGDRSLQIEIGVATPPLSMTVGAIGVQVGARAQVQVFTRVLVIDEPGQPLWGLRKLLFEDAQSFQNGELVLRDLAIGTEQGGSPMALSSGRSKRT
jgi:hypothetical protein